MQSYGELFYNAMFYRSEMSSCTIDLNGFSCCQNNRQGYCFIILWRESKNGNTMIADPTYTITRLFCERFGQSSCGHMRDTKRNTQAGYEIGMGNFMTINNL